MGAPQFPLKKKKKKKKILRPITFDMQCAPLPPGGPASPPPHGLGCGRYEMTGEELGVGSYSVVKEVHTHSGLASHRPCPSPSPASNATQCRRRNDGVLFAVKLVNLVVGDGTVELDPAHREARRDQAMQEVELLQQLQGHPNILQLEGLQVAAGAIARTHPRR